LEASSDGKIFRAKIVVLVANVGQIVPGVVGVKAAQVIFACQEELEEPAGYASRLYLVEVVEKLEVHELEIQGPEAGLYF
jgi:hypothetical protein